MKKSSILSEQARIKELRTVLNLQKLGVNYFCKCPFCNDPGSHFCVKEGAKEYVCFNCPKHGDTQELLDIFGHTHTHTHTQISISLR